MAGNAIDKSMLQASGAPIVFPQFDCNKDQDALNENTLAGGLDMPDRLLGIALTSQIVGFAAAAWLDGPKIDPGDRRRIAILAGKGTKGRKIVEAIDDKHVGGFRGHG